MTTHAGAGLARLTIAAPRRRIDVALPEHVALVEILPTLLQHAGEGLADEGEAHGGWTLRRVDGVSLDSARTLAAQGVRDGEVLHLVPRRVEWPELDYDDVVVAIASGSNRTGRQWSRRDTRKGGLAVAAAILAVGAVVVLMSGRWSEDTSGGLDWLIPGLGALGLSLLLSIVGIALSRAMADSAAGAIVAGAALPYAFVGGLVLLGRDEPFLSFGAPNLLVASAALLAISVIGYVGVADHPRVFVTGTTIGVFGSIAALLGFLGATREGSAATAVAAVLATLPAYPLLAMRIGKLPVPALPTRPEDLIRDEPMPERSRVFAAVVRADEMLTGMLMGASVVTVASVAVLGAGDGAAPILAAVVSLAFLLRARLFPSIRHRAPMLIAGVLGCALLVVGATLQLPPVIRLFGILGGLAGLSGLVTASALTYSKRAPSPYLGRIADILDVVFVVSVIPLTCAVLGLFGYVRGIGG